ncbi:MAG TPA: aminopeptidase [Solirubrobacteraceae bacterium]|nr:aminopeptidase [Solirubrobacteraceae bacterium]
MIDPDAFAALLCDWCLEVQPSQQVLVLSTTLAEPLLLALHRAILNREAWPLLRISPSTLAEQFHAHARDLHLDGYAPIELAELEATDAWLRVDAPGNTRALSGVDAAQITRRARAVAPLQQVRLSRRWCGTIWPTPALAQQAGMAQADYTRLIRSALFLDRPDPAEAWRQLSAWQAELIDRLSQAAEIRIEADGTDLRLRVDGRRWINSDGRRNMPSGEVFTGPREDSATGTVRFTVPSNHRGVQVEDVELRFQSGQVVSARAARGDDHLQAALAMDAGSGRLGELGIGSNQAIQRPTGSTLLDEKMAGTVHLALGRSYAETGGVNQSALHWDLICDLRQGGRLSADGEVIDLPARLS